MIRLLALLALGMLPSIGAQAQTYPSRTALLVVPFSEGGPTDVIGRMAADIFTRHLGKQFIVENIGGRGGTIGALRVARARADGYTLVLGHTGTHAAASALYSDLRYDPEKGFEPIGLVVEEPVLATVHKDFPANNLREFAAYTKANESKISMGHAGVGSVSYIGCVLLNSSIGIRPIMVPFSGTAPVMKGIVAGNIDYGCDPILNPLPHIKAGRAKALAIATKKRSPLLPNVPTSFEQGMPGFDCEPFYAVFAPKGTPKEVVDKLAAALNKGLDEPAVQKRFADIGANVAEPARRGPTALAELVRSEAARLKPILEMASAK
jgi:tripartite-type tricarboxylate transporter receptor subunit TctC